MLKHLQFCKQILNYTIWPESSFGDHWIAFCETPRFYPRGISSRFFGRKCDHSDLTKNEEICEFLDSRDCDFMNWMFSAPSTISAFSRSMVNVYGVE